MTPVRTKELINIKASGKNAYRNLGGKGYEGRHQKYASISKELKGAYLFTIGQPQNEWDVIEIFTLATVRFFTDSLTAADLGLPKADNPGAPIDPIPGVLRYFVLYPVTEIEESLMLLNKPFIDHYVTVAMLLTNNDVYQPLGAAWVGRTPTDSDKAIVHQIIYQLTNELTRDLDKSTIRSAPALPQEVRDLIQKFKNRALSGEEQQNFVFYLMNLPNIEFMEAVSQALPASLERNTWFPSEKNISKRAFELKQQMTESDQKNLRKAPWKSGWMMPNQQAKITFNYDEFKRDREALPSMTDVLK